LLDWVFPSLGMLGIVTRMTLKMVPSYKLRATCTVMSLADFQARACTHAPCLRATNTFLSSSNQAQCRQSRLGRVAGRDL
jgi:FAD/FMN-containing dehydrogenase